VHKVAAGVNATLAFALPATAVPIVGAAGTVAVVMTLEEADAGLVPFALASVTVNE
jgi:hypothetical protein